MDWALHRRRNAAAKMHLRLNLQTFLSGFAVIEEASHHDSRPMGALSVPLSKQAIRWQLWAILLLYVVLRFQQ